uniref:G-protein coupled receptors family 3 profile domain-containing protein n=1 Tax=Romanomermis culicivorax TaxID=13658 RepID=A0A915KN28_ROMCU
MNVKRNELKGKIQLSPKRTAPIAGAAIAALEGIIPWYMSLKKQATSVCVSTSLTAIVCQFCLFWPKVYIILFKPERNLSFHERPTICYLPPDETQMSVTKRSDLTTQILATTTKSSSVATQTEVAADHQITIVATAKQQPTLSKDFSRDDTTSTSLFLADSMTAGPTSTVPPDGRHSPFKLNVVHNNVGGAMQIDHLMGGTVIGGGGPAPTASPEMTWIDHEDSKMNIIISASGSTTSVNPVPNIIVASDSEIKWEFGDVPL